MVSNKTILILVIVNIILVVLIIIGIVWLIGGDKEVRYAPVPGDTDYTISEIIQKGQQDINFCDTLSRESYKEICKIENIRYRAQRDKNPAICEELENDEMVKSCKENAI